ncbi:MAG TPA: DUF4836 family protein [Bacteroidetes bacterium]|nr:DUF4836 family protein [Bacteroidota bacterium]
MKFIKSIAFLLLLSPFIFTNCKSDPDSLSGTESHIPATATSVNGIDLQRLMKKADFESVKQMDFYQKMIADAKKQSPALAAAMMNPEKSGIDLTGKIYLTTDVDKEQPDQVTTHIIVPLANAADFEALALSTDMTFKNENGLNIYVPENGKTAMIWSEDLLVLSHSNKESENVTGSAKKIFELKGEESLANNKGFRKAMSADHDLSVWMSSNTVSRNSKANMAMAFIGVDPAALEDNHIKGYADFENGKMVGRADFNINDELEDEVFDRFFKKEPKTDFSKVLPADKLSFAMTGALNFRGMDKFLSEHPQSKEYADFVLNDMGGVARKDILSTLNGDVMIAAYAGKDGLKEQFVIALALKNERSANAMLQKAVADKKLKELGDGMYKVVAIGGEGFSIRVNKGLGKILHKDGKLIYSPNEDLLVKIQKGELGDGSGSALNEFGNKTISGWLNYSILDKDFRNVSSEFFKNMHFNMDTKGADFIMETTEPDKNSLKSFFEMMDESYKRKNLQAM